MILEQQLSSPIKTFKAEDLEAKILEYGEPGVVSVGEFLDDQETIGLNELEQSLKLICNVSCANELK